MSVGMSPVDSNGSGKNPPQQDTEFAWRLLKSSPEAIGALTPEGIIEYLNPAAEKLLGVALKETQGRLWQEVVRLFDETGRSPFP